ncbi:MAG: ATP-binding cassette domain-containing protein [Raoultibacter sp.]
MNALEVRGLSLRRGSFSLRNVSFSVSAGEIFCLLGQTGAGKTILLEALAGAYRLSPGQIQFFGQEASDLSIQGRQTSFVYQDYGLFPHLSVYDNIAYGLKRHKVPRSVIARQVADIMELLAIAHIADQYPQTISGGERQRTALARAFVLKPQLLLLDEPFSALDPSTKVKMYEEVKRLHAAFGCTIVFVTHDFAEAQYLADRIGIMLEGELREVVEASALMEKAHDGDIAAFLGQATAEMTAAGSFPEEVPVGSKDTLGKNSSRFPVPRAILNRLLHTSRQT